MRKRFEYCTHLSEPRQASLACLARAGEGGCQGAGAGSQQRDEGRLGPGNTESLCCAHPGLLLGLCDGWNYTGKNTFYLVFGAH